MVLSTHMSLQSTSPVEPLSLATRLANALVSYAAYLGQSVYPIDLAPFYPHLGARLPIASAAGPLVLLVAISAIALFWWRRRPYLLVGWLWFLGMLVPVIGLVTVGAHAQADRYTYLSQIGISIALAWGVWSFYQSRPSIAATAWRWLLAAVSAGSVLVLAAMAWRQTSYWHDAETTLDAYGRLHRTERAGSLQPRRYLRRPWKSRGGDRPTSRSDCGPVHRSRHDRQIP